MRTVRIAITAVVLGAMALATALSITTLPFLDSSKIGPLFWYTAALWAAFGGAYLLLRRIPLKAAIILIVVGAVGIGGAAMAGPPNTSTDSARYAWDGIVQANGISPYRYGATSPHLADIRPDWLFPSRCDGSRIQTSHEPGSDVVVCTALNRGTAHTIYPPTSELLFAGIRLIVGPDAQYWPMQLAGLLMSLGILAMLLVALHRRGLDPRWAALWGWCPLVATEAITNSHVDTLGALLLLAATLLAASNRRWLAGIALGASIAAKLIPVIGAPALLRTKPWKIVLASVATFLVLYLPYLLASGVKVLGYLPKYLNEEGFDDGTRFALITLVAHGKKALPVAIVLLVVLAVLVWRKSNPAAPWLGQVAMIALTLLIVSPRYPWYGLLVIPMIAMTGRWEWLLVPLALTVRLLVPHIATTRPTEIVVVAAIALMTIYRAGPGWFPRLRGELRHPLRAPVVRVLPTSWSKVNGGQPKNDSGLNGDR
jgi:alpha-1,2-mannosyltransferase